MARNTPTNSGSRAEFPLTAWSIIGQAREQPTAERRAAIDELVRRYWKPIYAYFRAQRRSRADAEDLTQAFLQDFLDHGKMVVVKEELGRFRDWLRACLRNFLHSHDRRQRAKKRRPAGGLVSLSALAAADGRPFEPSDANDPESALDDAWRRDLLDRAFASVAAVCEERERSVDYEIFVAYYCADEAAEVTWQELAARHELANWKQAARRADWVKDQLARAIRREVARYAASEEDIDNEIRRLLE